MAERGGLALLVAQMRALANKAAKTAVEKAGKKTLENHLFKEVFEQIGRKLTLEAVNKAIPYISAAIGACFDTVQMKKVLDFADLFYHKRFLAEKEERVMLLTCPEMIEADWMDCDTVT